MNLDSLSKLDLTQEHKTFNQLLNNFMNFDLYQIIKNEVKQFTKFEFDSYVFDELKENAINLFIMKFIQQYIILDDVKQLKEYCNNYQSIVKVKVDWSGDKSLFKNLYDIRLKFAGVRKSFEPIKPQLDIIIFQTNIQKEILGYHTEIYNFNRFYPQDYDILEKYNQEAPAPRNYTNYQDK